MDYVDIKTSKSLYSLANFLQDWFCLYKVFQKSGIDYVILVGGSGLYVAGILKGYDFRKFDQQQKLFFEKEKQRLNFLTLEELQEEFEITFCKQNHSFKKPSNRSEHHNPRRLINKILSQKISKVSSLEATDYTNLTSNSTLNPKLKHVAYFVCIKPDFEELKIKIKNKVFERLDLGLVEEVKKLALSKDLFLSLGLDYRVVFYYLRGFFSKKEMVDRLIIENTKYAKRQMTWVKKQNPIWVKNSKDVLKLLKLLD
jgi:tRNA dimethylallyltransferase